MNPFDLRGPLFLVFYAVTAIVVVTVLYLRRKEREEKQGKELPRLEDPYLIAYLRGGKAAAIETVFVSLVDRKYITVKDGRMRVEASSKILDEVENELLREVRTYPEVRAVSKIRCEAGMAGYERELVKNGLMPDGATKEARLVDTLIAVILLTALSATKIMIALARGRTNIGFLIFLTVISVVIAVAIANPRLTVRGKRAMAHLETLLSRLRTKADSLRPNANTQELVLLAAVFGLNSVPSTAMPQLAMLFPKPASSGSDYGSGSSCGSSCGGGGCGGGCGGCGS